MNPATTMALAAIAAECTPTSQQRKAVLIDDDVIYRNLFGAIAESLGLAVNTFSSLAEMATIARLRDYDMVFVDYHLESFMGTEIAEYVDVFFPDLPVFLVSAEESLNHQQGLPVSIKQCFCKHLSPYIIIREALGIYQRSRHLPSNEALGARQPDSP